MSPKRISHRETEMTCAEGQQKLEQSEDGMDPKEFARSLKMSQMKPTGNRKTMQLCKQVERSLNYAFSSSEDEILQGLMVESVLPAPSAGHLLVTVISLDANHKVADHKEAGQNPKEIVLHLISKVGMLRTEIASDINRKRVPQLSFRCALLPHRLE